HFYSFIFFSLFSFIILPHSLLSSVVHFLFFLSTPLSLFYQACNLGIHRPIADKHEITVTIPDYHPQPSNLSAPTKDDVNGANMGFLFDQVCLDLLAYSYGNLLFFSFLLYLNLSCL